MQRMQSSGVKFLKLSRPTMTFNFSAVWRDTGRIRTVEKFVQILADLET